MVTISDTGINFSSACYFKSRFCLIMSNNEIQWNFVLNEIVSTIPIEISSNTI